MVTVTTHSRASPARNTGPRLSSATTSIMAALDSDLPPLRDQPGARRRLRRRGGGGTSLQPLPHGGPFRPEAPGRPDRKGLESSGRPGSPSRGPAPGRWRCPGHRPAGPGAQPWSAWGRGGRAAGRGRGRGGRPGPGLLPSPRAQSPFGRASCSPRPNDDEALPFPPRTQRDDRGGARGGLTAVADTAAAATAPRLHGDASSP